MKIQKGVRRFDLGEMRQATRTPQGFLMVPAFATRVGVFPYKDGKGQIRRELRHPDDVFDPESLATLKYAPVTIEHPPVMLDPENVSQYAVGHTTERVEVNRDLVDIDVILEQQKAIDAVEKDGIREISSGYHADIVEEEGTYNGAPYNFRQKNIKYNHVAAVKSGRAGPEVRMRLDSADAIMQGEISKPERGEFTQEGGTSDSGFLDQTTQESGKFKKVVINGKEVDLPSDEADTMQDMLDRFDEMRAKLSQLEEMMSVKTRKDKKDVDINQKGISPQVKVEQQGPDGRASATKIGPGDKMGPSRAKGTTDDDDDDKKDEEEHGVIGGAKPNQRAAGGKALADDDDEHDDDDDDDKKDEEMNQTAKEDPAGHEDYEAGNSSMGGGAAMGPVDRMKADMQAMRDKMDAMQGKLDEYAASSMNQPEKKNDRMDSAMIEKRIEKRARQRAALERQAEKMLPIEKAQKFDSMSDDDIRKAVIHHRWPSADLNGKSSAYIEARFDSVTAMMDEEGGSEHRREAGRRMLGMNGDRMDSGNEDIDPNQARLKMIQGSRDLYKQPLSANKK